MKGLINNATCRIILAINRRRNFTRAIGIETKIVGCTVVKSISDLKINKMISCEKKGRKNIITLTKKGLKLKSLLQEIIEL